MSNTTIDTLTKTDKAIHAALYRELRTRFGKAQARVIIESVARAVCSEGKPDILAVKAVADMLALFRTDARRLVKRIREGREFWPETDSKVACLEKRRLETEFRRIYRLYWISMKLFYPLLHRALAVYPVPSRFPRRTTEIDMAA